MLASSIISPFLITIHPTSTSSSFDWCNNITPDATTMLSHQWHQCHLVSSLLIFMCLATNFCTKEQLDTPFRLSHHSFINCVWYPAASFVEQNHHCYQSGQISWFGDNIVLVIDHDIYIIMQWYRINNKSVAMSMRIITLVINGN